MVSCEICGSPNIVKHGGVFICENCKTQYDVNEMRRMYNADVNSAANARTSSSYSSKPTEQSRVRTKPICFLNKTNLACDLYAYGKIFPNLQPWQIYHFQCPVGDYTIEVLRHGKSKPISGTFKIDDINSIILKSNESLFSSSYELVGSKRTEAELQGMINKRRR